MPAGAMRPSAIRQNVIQKPLDIANERAYPPGRAEQSRAEQSRAEQSRAEGMVMQIIIIVKPSFRVLCDKNIIYIYK